VIPRVPIGLRAVRAVVFGTVTLLLAAGGHLLAGGALPSLGTTLAAGLPIACASVVLARASRGPLAIAAALGVAQFALHHVFSLASATSCATPLTATGHGHHGGHLAHGALTACVPAAGHAGHHAMSAVMLTAHVAATALAVLLLLHGERLLVRLWTWARPRITVGAVAVPGLHAPVVAARTLVVVALRAATDVSRRGPPARLAVTFA
jgi:hypothetical protein